MLIKESYRRFGCKTAVRRARPVPVALALLVLALTACRADEDAQRYASSASTPPPPPPQDAGTGSPDATPDTNGPPSLGVVNLEDPFDSDGDSSFGESSIPGPNAFAWGGVADGFPVLVGAHSMREHLDPSGTDDQARRATYDCLVSGNDCYHTHHDANPGTEYWYGHAVYIPQGFALTASGGDVIWYEWHGPSQGDLVTQPLYFQAPWKWRFSDAGGGAIEAQIMMNVGRQFGQTSSQGADDWEVNGWPATWGDQPVGATPGHAHAEGEPWHLNRVTPGRWNRYVYHVKWSNNWDGVFEVWWQEEGRSGWTLVASHHAFPTRVYMTAADWPGGRDDLGAIHYMSFTNYRGFNASTPSDIYFDEFVRSPTLTDTSGSYDADRGTGSRGFRTIATALGAP